MQYWSHVTPSSSRLESQTFSLLKIVELGSMVIGSVILKE